MSINFCCKGFLSQIILLNSELETKDAGELESRNCSSERLSDLLKVAQVTGSEKGFSSRDPLKLSLPNTVHLITLFRKITTYSK